MAPARPKMDEQLATRLDGLHCCFVLADCRKPDHPITYASSGFYDLTGYSPSQVLGSNCRFLQGPETSRQKIMEMRDAIREERTCEVCLVNYKQSGDKFWNQFYLAPVLDENNCVTHYMGIQSDVSHLMSQHGACQTEDEENNACHQAHFLDVVHEEQQEAEGVKHVLTSWNSGEGVPASALPSSLLAPLMRLQRSFVLSDPNQPDCPIVHASTAFLLMTGYPRFLQGPQTDQAEVKRLRNAMTADPPKPITVKLLNYRIDGQPFWNNLHVAPIRSACGEVIFFVGVQLDITMPPTPKAAAPVDAAASSLEPAEAATASPCAEQAGQQTDVIMSPAASQQVQSQATVLHPGLACQPGSRSAGENGQSHKLRQLLTRSSAPAGSQDAAAAQAAMLPDNFHHRLRIRPGQQLCHVPECRQATIQHRMDQKGVVGAVRVACRSLSSQGLRRSLEDQASPRHLLLQQRSTDASGRRSLHMRQTM